MNGPSLTLALGGDGSGGPTAMKIVLLLSLLTLAPALLLTMTCFTRIIVVFGFLRQALGVQGLPPNQVLVGMALFLTAFVMAPVARQVHTQAVSPYLDGTIDGAKAYDAAAEPIRGFLLRQTREKDLELFLDLAGGTRPARASDVPLATAVPAFVLSELRRAFQMGVLLFIPFVLLDLIVGSILMSMGMVMLPPALIALPLKVALFVLIDGWHLMIGSLVRSFA